MKYVFMRNMKIQALIFHTSNISNEILEIQCTSIFHIQSHYTEDFFQNLLRNTEEPVSKRYL
jgi:hypothetical protein